MNESLTEIVTIADKPFSIFRSKMLLSFCRGDQITVSNGRTKKQDCVKYILNLGFRSMEYGEWNSMEYMEWNGTERACDFPWKYMESVKC